VNIRERTKVVRVKQALIRKTRRKNEVDSPKRALLQALSAKLVRLARKLLFSPRLVV
jgi:hypothetical protein